MFVSSARPLSSSTSAMILTAAPGRCRWTSKHHGMLPREHVRVVARPRRPASASADVSMIQLHATGGPANRAGRARCCRPTSAPAWNRGPRMPRRCPIKLGITPRRRTATRVAAAASSMSVSGRGHRGGAATTVLTHPTAIRTVQARISRYERGPRQRVRSVRGAVRSTHAVRDVHRARAPLPPRPRHEPDGSRRGGGRPAGVAGRKPPRVPPQPISVDEVLTRLAAGRVPLTVTMCCVAPTRGRSSDLGRARADLPAADRPCFLLGSGEAAESPVMSQMRDLGSFGRVPAGERGGVASAGSATPTSITHVLRRIRAFALTSGDSGSVGHGSPGVHRPPGDAPGGKAAIHKRRRTLLHPTACTGCSPSRRPYGSAREAPAGGGARVSFVQEWACTSPRRAASSSRTSGRSHGTGQWEQPASRSPVASHAVIFAVLASAVSRSPVLQSMVAPALTRWTGPCRSPAGTG